MVTVQGKLFPASLKPWKDILKLLPDVQLIKISRYTLALDKNNLYKYSGFVPRRFFVLVCIEKRCKTTRIKLCQCICIAFSLIFLYKACRQSRVQVRLAPPCYNRELHIFPILQRFHLKMFGKYKILPFIILYL